MTRFSLGAVPGDERIVNRIGERGEGAGQFVWPSGIALDSDRNLYVTDAWMNRVSMFTVEGDFIRSFGASGDGEGQFKRPSGIAIDADDNILVVDTLNHRIQKLTRDGLLLSQWGANGSGPGEFRSPWGITTDAQCCVYVADHLNHRIQKFDADGRFIFHLGSRGSGSYEFDHPSTWQWTPKGTSTFVTGRTAASRHSTRTAVTSPRHRRRPGPVEVAVGVRPQQSGRVQGTPPCVQSRTGVAFRAADGVAFDAAGSRLMVADTQRWRIQIYNKVLDYSEPQFNI